MKSSKIISRCYNCVSIKHKHLFKKIIGNTKRIQQDKNKNINSLHIHDIPSKTEWKSLLQQQEQTWRTDAQ